MGLELERVERAAGATPVIRGSAEVAQVASPLRGRILEADVLRDVEALAGLDRAPGRTAFEQADVLTLAVGELEGER